MKFKYSEEKIGKNLSSIFFLLLFPGYYFYHQGIALEAIPRLLGGFFSPVALIALISFVFVSRNLIIRFLQTKVFALILLTLLAWILASSTINYLVADFSEKALMYQQILNLLLLWGALFFIGVCLDPEIKVFKQLVILSSIVIALSLLHYVIKAESFFYYAQQLNQAVEGVATYQGFSRSAMVLMLLWYAYANKISTQVCIALTAIFVLFVLGSRSEFVGYAFSIGCFYLLRSASDWRRVVAILLVFVFVIVSYFVFVDQIMTSRQAQLFDLSQSTSWSARLNLQDMAIERIKKNPIVGDVGGHFKDGSKGTYAHNILSSWDAFGLLGIGLYFMLMFIPTCRAVWLMVVRKKLTILENYFCLLALVSFLLVLAAKSVYWPLPGLLWGLYVNIHVSSAKSGSGVR